MSQVVISLGALRELVNAASAAPANSRLDAAVSNLVGNHAPAPPRRAWLTVAEAAEALAVSPSTVKRRIADGSLTSRKLGGRRLVDPASVHSGSARVREGHDSA